MKARTTFAALATCLMAAAATSAWTASRDATPANIALGRAYRLEPQPNYDRALGPKGNELTDGELASGIFWTNGRSVGWSWKSPVSVDIDLGRAHAVDRVRVHSGANTTAGIRYPSQILVYGSNAAGRYDHLGSSGFSRDEDDPERAATRFIDIHFAARTVNRILLVAFARGSLIYLGEVEVNAAASGSGSPVTGAFGSLSEVRNAAIRYRQETAEMGAGPVPAGPDKARRWAMPLSADESSSDAARNRNGADCDVSRVDPWDAGSAVRVGAGELPDGFARPLVAMVGGADYGAWRVTNRSARELRIGAAAEPSPGVEVRFRALSHVQALNLQWVPDVAAPFEVTTLPPRSAMLLLAEVRPKASGEHRATSTLRCGEARKEASLPIIALTDDPGLPPLHGNLWTYIHEALHRPIARALECDAGFQASHGIDTAVVHPAALIDAGRGRPGNLLRHYLRTYRGAARVLLFMDIKSRPWPFLTMPDDMAAQWLGAWWRWVEENARAERLEGELLLFPIDEAGPGDVTAMTRFRALSLRAGIKARSYATVDSAGVAASLAWVDVLQMLEPVLAAAGPATGKERHLYTTKPDGRLLSPQAYYRAQGWIAYQKGLDGVGVWSSWDGTGLASPDTGWTPFGHEERDFGLVYSAPDGCGWPSRRLLALRRGIEENRILRRCAASMPAGAMNRVRQVAGGASAKATSQLIADVAIACAGREAQ